MRLEAGQEDKRVRPGGLLAVHRDVLARMAAGQSMPEVLTAAVGWIDARSPGLGSAILLIDRQAGLMRQVAAVGLPPGFADLVDGLRVGEGFGPWGAAAARGQTLIVSSLRTEPSLTVLAPDLEELGVGSMWVMPVPRLGGDEVIALIARYHAGEERPGQHERDQVAAVTDLLALAVERGATAQRLGAELNVDPLTGTFNRVRFMELVNESARSAPVAVICLEIDRFKPLRLTLGHHAGDRLLAEVGRRLLDVAGESGLVGHFSVDEFALMVEAHSEASVQAATDAIRERFRAPLVLDGSEFFLSFSLGIAYSDGNKAAYALVREAAAAMHAARAEGFGRRRVYDRGISSELRDRLVREGELRRALEDKELVMHYQPLMRLADRVWDRVETLVRWEHPTRGLVPPGEFVPLAEQAGLMGVLGERVLELVIAQGKLWAEKLPGIQLSVNVSGIELGRPQFGDTLLGMLAAAGLPPATLLLEVTESAILQDVDAAASTIARLREAGIRTAIDDFGTGYSSLARLGELPITGVKIDRAFVAGLGNDDKAGAIFSAIAQIVRAHGLLIIAEGIEDERALVEIAALGCDLAQGYHLCRPGPPELIADVLNAAVPEALTAAIRR
jgi:diguanylate cyclase (GGDEF)-like protein